MQTWIQGAILIATKQTGNQQIKLSLSHTENKEHS